MMAVDMLGFQARIQPHSLAALDLACSRLGAIYVRLNWRMSSSEIANLIEDTELSLLFGENCLNATRLEGIFLNWYQDC